MKIKLICIDMDGTLLENEHNVPEENKKAIKEALDKGIHVAITTGRVYNIAKVYSDLIGLKTPIIASNGAYIGASNGEELYKNSMSKKEVDDFYNIAKKYSLTSYLAVKSGIVSLKELPKDNMYMKINKDLPEKQQVTLEVFESVDNIFEKYPNDILKGICIEDMDKKKLKKAREELNRLNDNLEIVASWNNNFEVMKKNSSKGFAVKKLGEIMNVSRENIMCIGDSENDLSMIRYAGIGVAMGNAIDYIKGEADYVTDSNVNLGVAKAIRKYALNL